LFIKFDVYKLNYLYGMIVDCGYYCHIFCVEKIKRVCTAVVASEHSMILTITPSNGLLSQDYKCAECQSYIRIRNAKISPGNVNTISLTIHNNNIMCIEQIFIFRRYSFIRSPLVRL